MSLVHGVQLCITCDEYCGKCLQYCKVRFSYFKQHLPSTKHQHECMAKKYLWLNSHGGKEINVSNMSKKMINKISKLSSDLHKVVKLSQVVWSCLSTQRRLWGTAPGRSPRIKDASGSVENWCPTQWPNKTCYTNSFKLLYLLYLKSKKT